jgi:hypothetical protein
VRITASGSPFASQITWCFEPLRARSTGLGPVRSPYKDPDVRAVHTGIRQVQAVGRAQLGRHTLVQLYSAERSTWKSILPPDMEAIRRRLSVQWVCFRLWRRAASACTLK